MNTILEDNIIRDNRREDIYTPKEQAPDIIPTVTPPWDRPSVQMQIMAEFAMIQMELPSLQKHRQLPLFHFHIQRKFQ